MDIIDSWDLLVVVNRNTVERPKKIPLTDVNLENESKKKQAEKAKLHKHSYFTSYYIPRNFQKFSTFKEHILSQNETRQGPHKIDFLSEKLHQKLLFRNDLFFGELDVLMHHGRWISALRLIDQGMDLNYQVSLRAWAYRARILSRLTGDITVRETLQSAILFGERREDIFIRLANYYNKSENKTQALKAIDLGLVFNRRHRRLLELKLKINDKTSSGRRNLLKPQNELLFVKRRIRRQKSQFTCFQFIKILRILTRDKPQNEFLWFFRALFCFFAGFCAEALSSASAIKRLELKVVDLLKCHLARRRQDFAQVLRHASRVIGRFEKSRKAVELGVEALIHLDRKPELTLFLEKYLSYDPDYLVTCLLADCCLAQGQIQKAYQHFLEAKKMNSKDPFLLLKIYQIQKIYLQTRYFFSMKSTERENLECYDEMTRLRSKSWVKVMGTELHQLMSKLAKSDTMGQVHSKTRQKYAFRILLRMEHEASLATSEQSHQVKMVFQKVWRLPSLQTFNFYYFGLPHNLSREFFGLAKAIEDTPFRKPLYYHKALLLLKMRERSAAADQMENVLSLHRNSEVYAKKIQILLDYQGGHFDKCSKQLEKQSESAPPDLTFGYLWAKSLAKLGQPKRALQVVEQTLQSFPANLSLLNLKASLFFQTGQNQKSVETLELVLLRAPLDPKANRLLFHALYPTRLYQLKLRNLRNLIQLFGHEPYQAHLRFLENLLTCSGSRFKTKPQLTTELIRAKLIKLDQQFVDIGFEDVVWILGYLDLIDDRTRYEHTQLLRLDVKRVPPSRRFGKESLLMSLFLQIEVNSKLEFFYSLFKPHFDVQMKQYESLHRFYRKQLHNLRQYIDDMRKRFKNEKNPEKTTEPITIMRPPPENMRLVLFKRILYERIFKLSGVVANAMQLGQYYQRQRGIGVRSTLFWRFFHHIDFLEMKIQRVFRQDKLEELMTHVRGYSNQIAQFESASKYSHVFGADLIPSLLRIVDRLCRVNAFVRNLVCPQLDRDFDEYYAEPFGPFKESRKVFWEKTYFASSEFPVLFQSRTSFVASLVFEKIRAFIDRSYLFPLMEFYLCE